MDHTLVTYALGAALALELWSSLRKGPRSFVVPVLAAGALLAAGAWLTSWPPIVASLLVTVGLVYAPRVLMALRHRRRTGGARLARWAWRLHPSPGYRALRDLSEAAERAAAHDPEARAQLAQLAERPDEVGRLARASALHAAQDWEGLATLLAEQPVDNSILAALRLRSLAELGRLDALLATHRAHWDQGTPLRWFATLLLAAATGEVELARRMAELMKLDPEARARWVGRAEARAAVTEPTEEARAELTRATEALAAPPPSRAATATLTAIVAVTYAVQVAAGGVRALPRLGALVVFPGELDFEPWRVLAACALHIGWAHALFNLLALGMFGLALEQRLGAARTAFVGLVSGSIGVLLAAFYSAAVHGRVALVVGASSVVMGMVGAQLGGLLRERSAPGRGRRLRWLAGLLVLQTTLDLLTPQVSWVAHLVGAFVGLLLGLALTRGPVPTPRLGRRARAAVGAAIVIAVGVFFVMRLDATDEGLCMTPGGCADLCEADDARSCHVLEQMCDRDLGVACGLRAIPLSRDGEAQDLPRAEELYRRGCALDDGMSCYGVGYVVSLRGEPVEEWFRRACGLDYAMACEALEE